MLWWHTSSHSHKLLACVVLAYLANMATQGIVGNILLLSSSYLIDHWQVWRFLTYPLAISSTSTIIVSSFVLYNLAPEIEHLVGKQRFGLMLFTFVIIHGAVYLGIFISRNAVLEGSDALALALLTIYTYIYPKSDISILGFFTMRTWMMALLFGAIAIFPPLIKAFGNPIAVIGVMSNELFGVFAGLLFSQIYFEKYTFPTRTAPSSSDSYLLDTTPAISKPITSDQQRTESILPSLLRPSVGQTLQEDVLLDEDHLNEILDKINESGQKSLTVAEKDFLKRYADRL